MKINKGDFSGKRPKLEQDHLEDDVAILTVASVEVVTVPETATEAERKSVVLSFEETGELVFWPTNKEVGQLIDRLGDDTDSWVGRKVPIEKVTRTYMGKSFAKVGVVGDDEWDVYMKPAKAAKGARQK